MDDIINISASYGIWEKKSIENDFASLVSNGQNLIALTVVWGDSEWEEAFRFNFSMCEKYGIRVLVYDNVMNNRGFDLTEEDVRAYTASYSKSTLYCGNGFQDEPVPCEFDRLAHVIRMYRAVFPDKIAFSNLLPLYAAQFVYKELDFVDEYLVPYAEKVPTQMISTDVYPFTQDKNGNPETYENYIKSLSMQARVCRKYRREFWMYVQSMSFEHYRTPSLNDIFYQIGSALAFGAQGILYFCYDHPQGAISIDRTKLPEWSYIRMANFAIKAIENEYVKYNNSGAFLSHGDGVPECSALDAEDYTDPFISVSSDGPVLCGCFESKEGSGRAYILLNASEVSLGRIEDVYVTINGSKKVTSYMCGTSQLLTPVDGKYHIVLDCGGFVFITADM